MLSGPNLTLNPALTLLHNLNLNLNPLPNPARQTREHQ